MSFVIVPALIEAGFSALAANIVGFAVNMIASSILSKVFAPSSPDSSNLNAQQPNPGNRQQIAPAGDNKIPVVYGSAYLGGTITDLTISEDNQDIYWVLSLAEVTNTEGQDGGTPDTFTFGNVYWGGKKVIFGSGADVTGLQDESTGEIQDITGYMDIYLFRNGSNTPTNQSSSAITILSASNLIYQWDSTKLMTNCAFAIIHLKYNQDRNLTGLNQTRFQLTNSRVSPGSCFLDYLGSTRYGAAIPLANIDTASLTALNTYSDALFTYTTYTSGTATQPRFQFNGSLDTNLKIMQNIQAMSDCCDCLVRYDEITSLWGVVVQTPAYTVALNVNDSNMIDAITVSPIDLNNSFNVIEVKFPDGTAKDSFNSATFDLATIDPTLLFANEPVNKQSVNLYLTNNSVTAQYLANRMLEGAREDLQIQCEINYIGLELEAGNIITVTNTNYGWVAKLFRINKVIQKFSDDGKVTASLNLMEYNPAVYDDYNVTQFTPSPNTGIGSPTAFGTIPVSVVSAEYPSATNPSFDVQITTSSAGITQYAELWYSAYQYPTSSQYIYIGTTAIQSNGVPYSINVLMPTVSVSGIASGDWYLFSRMVNSIAKSDFSLASTKFEWRPTTFQYTDRYLSVAYADDITGTGFNSNPRTKTYYGLVNQTSSSYNPTASVYTWYLADPTFSTGSPSQYLAYSNRTGRKFSFATDYAAYASGTASFVPTTSGLYDPKIWSALPDGINVIDLDKATGQIISTGTTVTGSGQMAINNTPDGQIIGSLQQFLDFGGATTITSSALASLTIDIYGRVVGFTALDNFYMTIDNFVATSSQTLFTVTRASTYIQGQCLVFQNGALLNESEYTDTNGSTGTVTLGTGATLNDNITIISMRAISTSIFFDNAHIQVASVASADVVWNTANMPYDIIQAGDIMTFSNTGTPTQYTVLSVNYGTATITFTSSVTSVLPGDSIYFYRSASQSYRVFSRYLDTLTNAGSYTPTLWNMETGYEMIFVNGVIYPDPDYNIAGNTFSPIPALVTGDLEVIQFTGNNLTIPTGDYVNVVTYTVTGQVNYSFTSIANALNIFANGLLLVGGTDYTSTTGSYTLTNTPTSTDTVLLQQTFARYGAV